MRTRELMHLENSGHAGMNALFSKAHSAGWDIENDVDWSTPVAASDSLVAYEWGAFARTPTFRALPEEVKIYVTRRALGRVLNLLMLGESVALEVCAKLALKLRKEDQRNHACAQAMDEARHHLAYRRFLDKLGDKQEDVDLGMEMVFENLLQAEDPLDLIATEQFFLESAAMGIFENIQRHATNPLLRDILTLITRDESRHMGFGVLYIADWMANHSRDERIQFAQHWLPQMFGVIADQPGPLMASRVVQRLQEAGVDDAAELGRRMLIEQQEVNQSEAREVLSGRRLPHLLTSARRAGLLDADIVDALGLVEHPLVVAAQRGAAAS